MPKDKEQPEQDSTTFFSRGTDPDLLKKVDEYMDVQEPDPEVVPEAPVKFDTALNLDAGSAPLLPTDKLPDLEGNKKPKPSKPKHDATIIVPTPEVEKVPSPEKQAKEEQPLVIEPTEPGEPINQKDMSPSDELGLDDPQTTKAVDEIIAADADELIEAEDKNRVKADSSVPKNGLGSKIGKFFSAWWSNKKYRNATILLVFISLAVTAILPSTRYYVLNTAGVRASSSVIVLDEKTSLPLKNVELTIDGITSKTDSDGNARVEKIKLGEQTMLVKKPAFAEINRQIVVGWGSNPQGEIKLTPTGTQYTFALSDFLSKKPIAKAEANSGEASARSSDKGQITLTVPQGDKDEIEVVITAADYRTETLKISPANKEALAVAMVPAKKHSFITKRTGTLDLYKIDVDGNNEEKVLSGTGLERQDTMSLVPHAKKNQVALVSTRQNIKNNDGFLLSELNIVDLDTNETKKVSESERIQIVDWIGDKLVYVKITQGASEANTNRHKLMSYDVNDYTDKELATTNYFNDVLVARGAVYYSPAVYQVNGSVGLFKISPDGTNKKTIYDKEVWNLLRTGYDKIAASVGQEWYDLSLPGDGFVKASSAPPLLKSRVYSDSQNGQKSLWVDERDGKGVLVAYDTSSKQESTVVSLGGLKNPVLWIDNSHAVYRIANGQETADYVVSTDGGEPKKIKDVTNVAGVDRWYYY